MKEIYLFYFFLIFLRTEKQNAAILDSSDEEDDELNEYENDGFLVGDNEEEEEEEENEEIIKEKKKKKKTRKRKRRQLDADDIELLRENVLGITSVVDEDEPPSKYRRLKRTAGDDVSSARKDYLLSLDSSPEASPSRDYEFESRGDYSSVQRDSSPSSYRSRMSDPSDMFDISEYMDDGETEDYQEEDTSKGKYASMKSVYEPSELAESYMTDADEVIRSTDCPERYQRKNFKDTPTESELQEEAEWIARRLVVDKATDQIIINSIFQIIQAIRIDLLEIPYIATYLKSMYILDFQAHELWEIAELDDKWRNFHSRRLQLQTLFVAAESSFTDKDPDYMKLLREVSTEEELTDLQNNFELYHHETARDIQESEFRRPERRGFYFDCIKSGLGPMASNYGIPAKQFGENLKMGYNEFITQDHNESPEDLALNYLCDAFTTTELVLKACRFIISHEIANDFTVKKCIRDTFMRDGVISTEPTELGKVEITGQHILSGIKRLGEKPISLIKREGQMALILKALDQKFITINLHIPDSRIDGLIREMMDRYLSTEPGNLAHSWNNERKLIIEDAVKKKLIPSFKREIFDVLSLEARERILVDCTRSFRDVACYGPFGGKVRVVLSLIWGADGAKEPVMAVAVDKSGNLINKLRLDHMSYIGPKVNNNQFDSSSSGFDSSMGVKKKENIEALRSFILECKPGVIVVGANCLHARDLRKDIDEIIAQMRIDYKSVASVVWAPTTIPELCAKSKLYEKEFPKTSLLQKCAIALARMLQDPLPQLASLFNSTHDITSLSLHSFQSILPKTLLMEHLERVMIDYVNLIGLDINRALESPYSHTYPCIQFISGLGPRKADGLRDKMPQTTTDKVRSREDLATYEGEIVGRNMLGFLNILEYESTILDSTRIHPEHYKYARQVMRVINLEITGNDEDDDEALDQTFDSMKQSELLDAIKLIDFKNDRELSRIPSWLLEDITNELVYRFKDPRKPYEEPHPNDLFTYLTGETELTLGQGQLITATVLRVTRDEAIVKLDCGLIGKIDRDHISDQFVENVRDRIAPRQAVYCRIQEIDKQSMEVILSCRSSDLAENPSALYHDPYLLPEPIKPPSSSSSSIHATPSSKSAPKKRPRVKKRMITHPLFQNITFLEAEELLENAESGEFIFRPSSKGTDHLTLTYKFHDEFVHVDILEEDKPSKNELVLGTKLTIRDKVYDDLNHIEAHYLEPILVYAQEMKDFRKFTTDSEQAISDDLTSTKRREPNAIPYKIGVSTEYPGRYVLYYIPSKSLRKEYISCTPQGFRFRGRMFESPARLVDWFKKNWKISSRQPDRGVPPSHQRVSSSSSRHSIPSSSRHPIGDRRPPPSNYQQDFRGFEYGSNNSSHGYMRRPPTNPGTSWSNDATSWSTQPATDSSPWTAEWNN